MYKLTSDGMAGLLSSSAMSDCDIAKFEGAYKITDKTYMHADQVTCIKVF